MNHGIMPFMKRTDDTRTKAPRGTISPVVGLVAFSALIISASTLPTFFLLRRRLARADATLAEVMRVAKTAASAHTQAAKGVREIQRVGAQVEVLRGLVDKVGGDVKDVRSLVMKDRARLFGMEARFDELR